MIVLGIETSCDETAAAVVDESRRIHANVVRSQLAAHDPFGGVVPEIAARSHVEAIDGVVARALSDAGMGFGEIDGIAATAGPGLIGGVMVGLTTAKAIAMARRIPLIAVNHLEAHALTARLSPGTEFPYLLLLISGGHCQLLMVAGVGAYRRLGTTVDDALGEAFDKVAKLLGLGYPGGPAVELAAADGDPGRFALPRPMVGRPGCHFSFSGLKTAVRLIVDRLGEPTWQDVADLCAAFQTASGDAVVDRVRQAAAIARTSHPELERLVIAGGVAANSYLRSRLAGLADETSLELVAPPIALCTDNAAMVAWTGIERLRMGLRDPLDCAPRARWPLDPAAAPATGAGVKA